MSYGIPTLMGYPDTEALVRFCADNGFGFVEINMTFPWFQPGCVSPDSLRALSRTYGVGYTIHLHDQVNPFEFSPEMRRGSLEHVQTALDWALALDIPRVNMHLMPGTYSTINGVKTWLYETCTDPYLELVRAFRDMADEKLKGRKTVLCIENTSGFQPFHREAIRILLESPAFGLTFDIGHSFRAGGEDERFILANEDRLCHFHIHDCTAKANHLGLGEGQLDLVRYLKTAKRLGASVVAEVKEAGALIRSKEYLIEHQMWEESKSGTG